MTKDIVLGVDVGSTKISAVIGKIDKTGSVTVKGIGTSVSAGLVRGEIQNIDAFRNALERAIQRAECRAGVRPSIVLTNLPLFKIQFTKNSSMVVSSEASGLISHSDKSSALRKTRKIVRSAAHMIVHVIPLLFRVDGLKTTDPVGVAGTHLETEAHCILADAQNIRRLTQCYKQLNLEISGLIYGGLSLGEIMISEKQKENDTLLIDVGGEFTKVSFFSNQTMMFSEVIPIGGANITSDISQCLKVGIPEAERLKIIHGNCNPAQIDPAETIHILADGGRQSIKKQYLCQIIEARVEELFKFIRKTALHHFDTADAIVLAGNGSFLNGLPDYIFRTFKKTISESPLPSLPHQEKDHSATLALANIFFALRAGAIGAQPSKRKSFAWLPFRQTT